MADLKLDLTNKLKNDKYYVEMELIRLAQEPKMNYKDKIDLMADSLKDIAIINAQFGLIEEYFRLPEEQSTDQKPVEQQPSQTSTIHAGQTHGE